MQVIGFFVAVALWLAVAAVLVGDPGRLDAAWSKLASLPLVARIILAALLLPWFVALVIWRTSWPLWLRAVLVIGIAWANLFAFFPWR